MSLRAVFLFLLIMVLIALFNGPGVRRFLARFLGINRRGR